MENKNYDVIVIGAGPGGYVAAIHAAQLRLDVCVIEKEKVGGVCLNWGCIPSKSLIHQAGIIKSVKDLKAMGISVDTAGLDYGRVNQKSRNATKRLIAGVEFLLKKNRVDYIQGTAHIISPNRVDLEDGGTISGKNIIIATGSRPMQIPGFEFDEDKVLSSTGALSLTELPKSLVILGGGAIGCEFAYIMNAFGVDVTLVEMAEQILPFEDDESVSVLMKSFKKSRINVLTGTRAVSLEKSKDVVSITLLNLKNNSQTKIEAEKALVVFGRLPNTGNIGLENIGVTTEKGFIPVGDFCQTNVKGIYAIGDVTSTPLLAHVASKEGEIAASHIAGKDISARINIDEIPSAIYCEPQIASFGLRESQALALGIPYKKVSFPYRGTGKAVATETPDGMVKILFNPENGEISGAHIAGHGATELIHQILLAKTNKISPEKVAEMIHAHPTLSEAIMECMRAVHGNPIHA